MKSLGLWFCLVTTASAPTVALLVWDPNPVEEAVIAYHLYESEDLQTWTHIGLTTETNWVITAIGQRRFYYATASNYWGESERSDIASTPRQAGNIRGLRISRTIQE